MNLLSGSSLTSFVSGCRDVPPHPCLHSPIYRTNHRAQAASLLINIFSDENRPHDDNFQKGNNLQALSGAIDSVRRAVRSVDRKKKVDVRYVRRERNFWIYVEYLYIVIESEMVINNVSLYW